MATNLPINFPIPSESAIASYNWRDIADGAGYYTFYLLGAKDGSGETTLLTPSSSITGVWTGSTGGGFNETSYFDFDVTFKIPRTMNGLVYFSGQTVEHGAGGAGSVTATLIHYDGSTETTIGAELGSTASTGTKNFCIVWDVSQTKFAVGDILRLSVKTSAGHIEVSADPSGTVPTSQVSKLSIPFKVDL